MAQQISVRIYQSSPGIRPVVIAGGPVKVSTPIYQSFPVAGIQVHTKTNFKNFFGNGQDDPAFWPAINSVIESTDNGVLYASPNTVAELLALANS